MAKITSVKTSADNDKLFTAQTNDDNTREFKEFDISSGINNKTLQETADVTSFDDGMDVITVNPSGDKFLGVDRRGREVINMETSNNFSVNAFNLLSSFKVDRLVRGDINLVVKPGYDTSFFVNKKTTSFGAQVVEIYQTTDNKILVSASGMQINGVASPPGGMVILKLNIDGTTDNSFTPITSSKFIQLRKNHITGRYFIYSGSTSFVVSMDKDIAVPLFVFCFVFFKNHSYRFLSISFR